jgi:hypothetical protein
LLLRAQRTLGRRAAGVNPMALRLTREIPEIRRRMVPVWSAARAPSHARLSRLKTPRVGRKT